jgi:FkbM family methyltransferase
MLRRRPDSASSLRRGFRPGWTLTDDRRLQRPMNYAHDSVADRRIAVQQITLARIMDQHQVSTVNYLKMDSEGSEFEILRSIGPAHWARIERVVLGPARFYLGQEAASA